MRFLQELLKGLLCTSLTVASLSPSMAQAGGNLVTKPSIYPVTDEGQRNGRPRCRKKKRLESLMDQIRLLIGPDGFVEGEQHESRSPWIR